MKRIIVSLILFVSLFSIVSNGFAQTLNEQTKQALIAVLSDEYNAKATYQKVLNTFGNVRPFANIIRAEQYHITLLLPLFEKYGVAVPQDDWASKVPEFATLQDALQAGVAAEIANAQLYDGFLTVVQEEDLRTVFTQLRDASQNNHLPAFQRSLERTAGQLNRPGQGRGHFFSPKY